MSIEVVEATIFGSWLAYGRPRLVVVPWNAAILVQRLRRLGLKVVETTSARSTRRGRPPALLTATRDYR